MQRPQVDLAVKRRLKRVWVSIRVFLCKYIVRIFSELPRFAREGPPPAPTPLVGPTNLQFLATPLLALQLIILQSTSALLSSTRLSSTLLHPTIAPPGSTSLYFDSTTLYHASAWLYVILLYSTTLYRGSTWLCLTPLDSNKLYHGSI